MTGNCIEKAIRRLFYGYGKRIVEHPRVMIPLLIIVPLIITGVLGTGMIFLTSEKDIEVLYVPQNAESLEDRKTIEHLYAKYGDEDLLSYQRTRLGLWGQVILVPKTQSHDNNVLTVLVLEEALRVHDLIVNITVGKAKDSYKYHDICLTWDGQCYTNGILDLIDYNASNIIHLNITYPISYSSQINQRVFLGTELGGVTYESENDVINAAKVLQLTYNLRYDSKEEEDRGVLWEDELLHNVQRIRSDTVNIYRRTSHSLEQELDETSKGVIPLMSIAFTIVITFAIVSCFMLDCVKTKPWLASFGVLSAGMAILSSFGLLSWIQFPYVNMVGLMPFLILGIGCDDMFVMIAAWRTTDTATRKDDGINNGYDTEMITPSTAGTQRTLGHQTPNRIGTKDRMPISFCEAAMSITITSLTNCLAFGIGSITPFYSVRIFCAYTGTAVLFSYLYQITFFAAIMVLTGLREDANRHFLTCRKVKPKSEHMHWVYLLFCSGGTTYPETEISDTVTATRSDESKNPLIMRFFKNCFGPFITNIWILLVIGIIYVCYLAGAVVGLVNLEYGLELTKLLTDGSYANPYFDLESKYFQVYGPRVFITVTEKINYWERDIQESLENTLTELEHSEFYHDDSKLTVSWLRDYLWYMNVTGIVNPSESEFISILMTDFLPLFRHYIPDIVFDKDSSGILSSRSYVTFQNVNKSELKRKSMVETRKNVSKSDIVLIAYHPAFTFFDQYIVIIPTTVLNLSIALLAMILVSLFLIPNLINAIFVSMSIASILVGVMGYMSVWNITLDSISMINLVLCVGFSVDYSAHIMYAFASQKGQQPRERTIHALYTLGMPITQGAVSTILGVIILSTSDSYIFRTFFKIMLLVIVFGTLHGLVFLPDLLMICSSICGSVKKTEDNENVVEEQMHVDKEDHFDMYNLACEPSV